MVSSLMPSPQRVVSSDAGRWSIATETESVYVLDLTARTAVRVPARPNLRRDYETLPLLAVEPVEVGRPLVMTLDLRGDGIDTVRTTSLVTQIARLADGPKTEQ